MTYTNETTLQPPCKDAEEWEDAFTKGGENGGGPQRFSSQGGEVQHRAPPLPETVLKRIQHCHVFSIPHLAREEQTTCRRGTLSRKGSKHT